MSYSRLSSIAALCLVYAICTPCTPTSGATQNHIGKNQKMLVICVKFSNVSTTRLAKSSDWVTLLNQEVSGYYKQATFNQTTFKFESPSGTPGNGWFDLGYPDTSYEFFKTAQYAINLIDPHVNFASYDRVLVITNWPHYGGIGGGP